MISAPKTDSVFREWPAEFCVGNVPRRNYPGCPRSAEPWCEEDEG